jgi:hypothetical protein
VKRSTAPVIAGRADVFLAVKSESLSLLFDADNVVLNPALVAAPNVVTISPTHSYITFQHPIGMLIVKDPTLYHVLAVGDDCTVLELLVIVTVHFSGFVGKPNGDFDN